MQIPLGINTNQNVDLWSKKKNEGTTRPQPILSLMHFITFQPEHEQPGTNVILWQFSWGRKEQFACFCGMYGWRAGWLTSGAVRCG